MRKLRCEGIFTHREYDVVTEHPPYYVIYKKSSGGVYEASDHFNGVTALIKGRKGDYGQRKAKVMSDFLHKVYRHGEGHHGKGHHGECPPRGARTATHPAKTTTKERHISQLMKNTNPLYIRSDSLEDIYRGCYFPPRDSPKGAGPLKLDKRCLSHNYVLLDWDDESRLEGPSHEGEATECRIGSGDDGSREEDPSRDEKDIWGFMHISGVDLLETHFEEHLRELYHERLRKKDKGVAVLLSFLLHQRVVRNLRVKSMTEMHIAKKGMSSGQSPKNKDQLKKGRGLTKEVLTLSFDMHARNNHCVDHLSFLMDKFHCEDVTNGTFFTNSFLSKQMYAHSRRLKEEVRYENVTLVEGLKRGVFLLSYLFSQMGRANRLVSSDTSYGGARRSYTIGVEDRVVYMPTLFRDHLYFPSDYVIYWEDSNHLARQRTVDNVTVEKKFKGEGMKRGCRVTVRVACDGAACGEATCRAPPLRDCSAIVLDLHPNGVVLDKERLSSPHLTASFADIESYKGGSPHTVTKYRVWLSDGRPSSGGLTQGGGEYERKDSIGDLPGVVPLTVAGEDTTGQDTAGEDTTRGSSHQPCSAFSFDLLIGSRYVAPCEGGKQFKRGTAKGEVHMSGGEEAAPTYQDNLCTDYDAVVLSNAKVFLKCGGDAKKESPTTHHHARNATLYADVTHVYINGGEDMLSVHTRDFFLFLSEVSFVQVLSPRWVDDTQGRNKRRGNPQWGNAQRGNVQRGGDGQSGEGGRREDPPESLPTYSESAHCLSGYSLARTINSENIINRRIIYNEVLAGGPSWQHVAAANDVEMLRWPPLRDILTGGTDYYVDVVYVHSVPRGADSYLHVLYVSVLTSALVVLCTFVLARRFSQ
ncbi:hypothetical protein C922_04933 [Plasmodium inui San Antonio 1]|uniref:Uncharacterized protein n=1 Tax=Plasmodium inui San Antonio 1 TaxID=1237626 RepID=W6ZV62_9APIC|nr:hypothetical protein C922_04933 [Plasmodium inui San Antonio 1]EUD64677.1 hypothetical protein C922_04933 [Plasmodium inui San Antonio 1]